MFDDEKDDVDDDATIVYRSLTMYANWIETGDVLLSAVDAAGRKMPFKALDVDQMGMVVRLRRMADVVLRDVGSGKSMIR